MSKKTKNKESGYGDELKSLRFLQDEYQNGVYWQDIGNAHLVNRKIVSVWWQEWDDVNDTTGLVMLLDNGTTVWVQQDDEGNGPGALYLQWTTNADDQKSENIDVGFTNTTLPVGPTSKERTAWAKKRLDALEETGDVNG